MSKGKRRGLSIFRDFAFYSTFCLEIEIKRQGLSNHNDYT